MLVPEGFVAEDHGSSILMLRTDVADDLRPLLLQPPWERRERLTGARWYVGRAPTPSVPLGAGRRVVLRTYRHGGMLGGLTRGIFVGLAPRPFRELRVSERARARGVPTPPVLGAAVYPVAGPIYRGCLAVEEIEDGRDGLAVLQQAQTLPPGQRRKLAKVILRAAGRAVARAHEAGLVHTDLNVKNLLICPEPLGIYLLDLDKCRMERGPLSPRQRRSQILRLFRSLAKVERQDPDASLADRERMHFLLGYCDGSGQDLRQLQHSLERWW